MFKRICIILLTILLNSNNLAKSETNNEISQTSIVGSLTESDAFLDYKSFFNNVDDSFIIPGLTTNMCPQGLCKAKEYILITSYDPYRNNNSCIYVLDIDTGEYKKTVWLKENKTHVGGITFDGEYVYIANSCDSSLSKVLLDKIIKAEDNSIIDWELINIKNDNNKNVRASFCVYDNKRKIVWVGTYNVIRPGYAYGYSINDNRAELTCVMRIPRYVQGLIFDKEYIYYSLSYGSYTSSRIYKCTYNKDYNKNEIDYYSYDNIETILAPPGSENIFIHNGNLYILFESAANCYYKNAYIPASFDPVDRVCKYNI